MPSSGTIASYPGPSHSGVGGACSRSGYDSTGASDELQPFDSNDNHMALAKCESLKLIGVLLFKNNICIIVRDILYMYMSTG